MKRNITKIFAALALLVFMMPTMAGWGQSTTYTSNVTLPVSGTNVSSCKVVINGTQYDGTKLGKSNTGASANVTIPSGTTTLYVHCACWNNKSAKLALSTTASGVSITPTGDWTLTSDSGIANNSPFTLANPQNASTSYFREYTLTGVTSDITVKFEAKSERAVFWGVNATNSSTNTPSITAEPVAIQYGANSGQITYTLETQGTSGAVSASVPSGSWITLPQTNNLSSPVSFTCSANPNATYRSETVTLTYTYSGGDPVSTQVTITQAKDPNGNGSENDPFTVAEAIAATPATGLSDEIYVSGIVSEIVVAFDSQYGNISYNISADGETTGAQLEAFRGKGMNGANFTTSQDILPGDEVTICGSLQLFYGTTYELASGNYLVAFNRPGTYHNVAYSANPAAAGTVTFGTYASSPASVAEGASVNISATANNGYVFSNWTVSGTGSSVADATSATTTFTMGTADATLTANFTAVDSWDVTYHANGGTGDDVVVSYNEGDDVTVADNTFGRPGYTFVKWNTMANGTGTDYAPGDVIEDIDDDIDLYAQWQESSETQDCLDRAFTGVTNTTYTDWTGTGTSGAAYAGNSAGGNTSIQLRSTNNSGIVSTTSGGKVMKVEVEWQSNTSAGRVLQVYGSNDAYTEPSKLYATSTQGTLLGTIVKGTSTSLNITGDYAYVGLRSASGAMYLSSICITWGSASALAAPAIAPATLTFVGSQEITITAAEGASIRYTLDGTEPTATTGTLYEGPFTITNTTTVKAIAYNETASSEVTTATYTRQYNINLVQTTGGIISASAEQAAEGAEVTLTATANVGYSFSAWSVNPNVTVASNQFVMPASDVTVTASFVEATAYTVSFYINNKVEMTATVNNGGEINLSNFQAVPTVEGYSFAGWSTTPEGAVLTGNYAPQADASLYAQFGEVTASGFSRVTSADELTAGDQIVIAANGTKNVAMSTTQNTNNRGVATITKVGNSISYDPEGDIAGAVVCELTLGTNHDHWTLYDPVNGGYLYAASGSSNWLRTQATNDANGEWTITIENGEATLTAQGSNIRNLLRYNAGDVIFSCYGSGQQTVWLYRKPAAKLVKGNREVIAAKATVTGIAANVLVTVKEDGIVYLTGNNNGNAANLVVEDGGQLVASANVQGTMLKDVTGYGSNTTGNYYLISSPLTSSTNPEDVLHMINTAGYDLYYFDQNPTVDPETGIGLEWRNYKQGEFSSLQPGSGYLYANSEDLTLEFAGTLAKGVDATSQKAISYQGTQTFAGWNLVGNPFPCNAAVNMAFYKMNSNNDGISTNIMSANDVIAPMEGVFVLATSDGGNDQKVTFTATTDAVTTQDSKGITLEVNRENVMLDRAIVGMNEGSMVSKLRLSNGVTELYIPQGDKDYALVGTNGQGELPVNFKASRNATYTISTNAESMEMNYLHLIDNLTGADVDLLATPSYTFDARTTDYASRFKLVFKAGTGIDENTNTTQTFAFFNGESWSVSNQGEATLQVVDMTGRVISNNQINGNATININETAGIYMLRLVNGNNTMIQKIVVR